MTFPSALCAQAERLLEACRTRGLRIVTAESCTGGLIAACLTEVAGSSDVFERGFVVYSNEAKQEALGVPGELIARVGAVSRETAIAMATCGLARSRADLAVAVTGIAGPGGGTPTKPVGLVHHACAFREAPPHHRRIVYEGDRAAVRLATLETALAMLAEELSRSDTRRQA